MLVKIEGRMMEKFIRKDKKTGEEKYYIRLFQKGHDIINVKVEFETYNMFEEELEKIELQVEVKMYQFDNKAFLTCKEVA